MPVLVVLPSVGLWARTELETCQRLVESAISRVIVCPKQLVPTSLYVKTAVAAENGWARLSGWQCPPLMLTVPVHSSGMGVGMSPSLHEQIENPSESCPSGAHWWLGIQVEKTLLPQQTSEVGKQLPLSLVSGWQVWGPPMAGMVGVGEVEHWLYSSQFSPPTLPSPGSSIAVERISWLC